MRRVAALVFCIATWTHTATIRAEPPPRVSTRLDLRLGPGVSECPGEERLRQEVSLRMGYDPFDPGARRAVSISIERRGGELVGTAVFLDEAGQPMDSRVLTTPATTCGCWSLVTYLAVAIAIPIAPLRAPEDAAGPPAPPPIPAPPACPPPPVPRARPESPSAARAQEPRRPARLALEAGAGGLLGWGPTAQAVGGGFVFFGLRWPKLSVALEGRGQPPATAAGDNGAALDLSLTTGAALLCFHEGIVFACGAGQIGSLRLSRKPGDGDAHAPFTALGGRTGVEVPLWGRFLLQLRAEALATVTPAFVPIGDREVWKTPAVSGLLGAGVTASF
jgi:hypothetical protein